MQFEPLEKWIWLPRDAYPDKQTTTFNVWSGQDQQAQGHFTVARFYKAYQFDKPIKSVKIRTSGDTFFRLSVNGKVQITGPCAVGGDFLLNNRVRPQYYATESVLSEEYIGLEKGEVSFSAIVRIKPIRMFEYSLGHGGFFLTAHIRFVDGTKTVVTTGEDWMAEYLPSYTDSGKYDNSLSSSICNAEIVPNIWHSLTSPIPSCKESLVGRQEEILIPAGERVERILPLDMIYTGYPHIQVKTKGKLSVEFMCMEREGDKITTEEYVFLHDDSYTGFNLYSAGVLKITAKNEGDTDSCIIPSFMTSCYPVETQSKTTTSDKDLNLVLDVCTHTLQYCRQSLHLDSGQHCEPLACTGDYYIESLMTAFTFGDMRLATFDVRRTAQVLRYNDGKMFHTSYSLIWVQMLWDVYMFTGEKALLTDCEDSLTILLERFASYLGDNGIIENPPDYMFVDWLYPDGISLHHPPKALGQTCLNLFYYGALKTAQKIYSCLQESVMAEQMEQRALSLRKHIVALLYDRERGLFFEGLNTPTPDYLLKDEMPQNVEKRYYRKHANILAAYFEIFDKESGQALLHKVMTDATLGEVQPYFCHFLLEAIYRNGLRDTYTLAVLENWKAPVLECPYGLAEGFYKPEPTYSFDHSHAWGGTPVYSLPLALTGLEMIEPAYRKIKLNVSLLGLENAYVEIPTPYGLITVTQKVGEEPIVCVPNEIKYIVE